MAMRIGVLAFVLTLLSCGDRPTDPLGQAAADGDLERLQTLLADRPGQAERNGALIAAARAGQPHIIRALAAEGADVNAHAGVNGWPALMHAVHKNRSSSVRALLDLGANPNERAPNGATALIMAAGYGDVRNVRLVLHRGADPRIETFDGASALTMAVSGVADIDKFTLGSCQTETVQALLDAAPDLKLNSNLWDHIATRLARYSNCGGTLRALENRKAASPTAPLPSRFATAN